MERDIRDLEKASCTNHVGPSGFCACTVAIGRHSTRFRNLLDANTADMEAS